MNKKKQVILYLLVGTMFLSVIGTGLLLVFSGDTTTTPQTANQEELDAQLEQLQQQQNTCALTGDEKFDPAGKAPKVTIPEGDVTELSTRDIKPGSGKEAQEDSCVTVHYEGYLVEDGSSFDSSYKRDEPAKFSLTQVIPGWQQGVSGMKVGGVREITIPSDLAYGEAGSPPTIPENADLIFVVEIIAVE